MTLNVFSSRLNEALHDMRLDQVAIETVLHIAEEMGSQRAFFQNVMETIERQVHSNSQKVELSGTTNILNYPEYSDMNKAKEFLNAIEGKDTLYQMLRKAATLEFSVTIGEEKRAGAVKGLQRGNGHLSYRK